MLVSPSSIHFVICFDWKDCTKPCILINHDCLYHPERHNNKIINSNPELSFKIVLYDIRNESLSVYSIGFFNRRVPPASDFEYRELHLQCQQNNAPDPT